MIKLKIKKNVVIVSIILILVVFSTLVYFFLFRDNDGQVKENVISNDNVLTSCTRTTRLDNIPSFDRALSIIHERYKIWEEGNPKNFGTYNYFDSQLTNCIKIEEIDEKSNPDNLEGYFVFNGNLIQNNFFPIYVNKSYRDIDDITIALLLVHEITHVRQYLDYLNGVDTMSCIDKETEAFDAGFNFARWQYGENEKTIDLRIKYDEELHPQLQIYKSITESFPKITTPLFELCGGNFDDSCYDKITEQRRNLIKTIISSDPYYIEQCDL